MNTPPVPAGCVYAISNTANAKLYVGQTRKPARRRFAEHCEPGRRAYISRAIRKYGREKFTVEVLEWCSTDEDLNAAETFWIDWYGSQYPAGYNAVATPGCGAPSPLTRAKMSAAATASASRFWLGKKRSDEDRARMSAGQRRRYQDPGAIERISAAHRGKIPSDETLRRMSVAQKERLRDPANKAVHAAARVKAAATRLAKRST